MQGNRLGPYRVLDELGSGGMGRVHLAEVVGRVPGLALGERVALKIVHPHLLDTPGAFKRFLREAQIGQAVDHPNVVRCLDCDAALLDGVQQNYLVMEYVEGQTLRSLLDELETVPEDLCRKVGSEVAQGLAAIHAAGAVHRDLKPGNVLIAKDHTVKIMDLGVAHLENEAIRLSRTGAFVGSVLYAPPEAFGERAADLDARADLYALGVLLYEIATGQHPFRHAEVRVVMKRILDGTPRRAGDIQPQLSPYFEELIHTLMARERHDRLPSAQIAADVLQDGEQSGWWADRALALRRRFRRPLRRIRIPRETALYGRDDTLAAVEAAWQHVKAGEGRVLLLGGEAGIGKTRLVDECLGRLESDREDVNVLLGGYPPGGAATSAGAFSRAYREHLGEAGLEVAIRELLPESSGLVPAFAALLRGEPPPQGVEALTQDALQTVFVQATHAIAKVRPTVVLIDDLHFAPAAGRALFATLAAAVADHPVLLLGTMRRGMPETWLAEIERHAHVERIDLQRLGAKDLARLLEDAFHSKRLAAQLGHEIAVRSDGNPYFVFEIVQGLKESGFLAQQSDGTWDTTGGVPDLRVPSSIESLVRARTASLSSDERDLLDVAACAGFEFDPLLVADALGLPHVPTLKSFSQIERAHRLVHATGRHLVFDHHNVHHMLYEGLLPPLREEYHALLAAAIEGREDASPESAGDLDPAVATLLCEHWLAAHRAEPANRYLPAALEYLRRRSLYESTLRVLDQALAIDGALVGDERVEAIFKKIPCLEVLGRRDDQEAALDAAEAGLTEISDPRLRLRLQEARGVLCDRRGEFQEARTVLEACVEQAHESGWADIERQALGSLGNVIYTLGDYEAAKDCYERSLELARAEGDVRAEARATGSLGNIAGTLGQPEEAERCFRRLIDLSRETGDRRSEGAGVGNLGVLALMSGRYAEACALTEQRLEIVREIGDRKGEAHAHGMLGSALRALGRDAEAFDHLTFYLATSRELGDPRNEGMAAGYLADLHLGRGEYADARRLYERQGEIAEQVGDTIGASRALHGLGAVYEDQGRLAAARDAYEACRSIAADTGDRQGATYATSTLAVLDILLGRTDEAVACLEAQVLAAREIQDRGHEAAVLRGWAAGLAQRGAHEAALERVDEAIALQREVGEVETLPVALVLRGQLMLAAGLRTEAAAAWDEAAAACGDGPVGGASLLARILHTVRIDDDVGTARHLLASNQERLDTLGRLEARLTLWEAEHAEEDRAEVRQLLAHLLAHAPEEDRERMVAVVPLFCRAKAV